MGWLKSLLPFAGAAVGGAIGGPVGASIGGGLTSAVMGGLSTKNNAAAALAAQLRAERPNQTNASGATSNWTQDAQGNWTQKVAFGPEEQARRDLFNQIAQSRMQGAKGIDLSRYAKPIDWDALGFGAMSAATGGSGTTGKRPWANAPYTSMGGDYLRNLQYAAPTSPLLPWASMISGSPTQPPGGG